MRDAGTRNDQGYRPIDDYALISDCHSAALVATTGSIDWCCMPRIDSPSIFGRLLDRDRGGHCAVHVEAPDEHDQPLETARRYLGPSMVLETTLRRGKAEIVVTDALAMTRGGAQKPRRQLLRAIECRGGPAEVTVDVAMRFDYGSIRPWLRDADDDDHRTFAALGGSEGMLVWSDLGLAIEDRHDLRATCPMDPGERRWLSLEFCEPETIDARVEFDHSAGLLDDHLSETVNWWHDWVGERCGEDELPEPVLRSAIVLKSLVHAPTGAIAAAPTTSLPEEIGGSRNWDYRFTWIRDSWFTVKTLADIGFEAEADGFRRFVERSAAGNIDDLNLLYSIDGGHRNPEYILDLDGYCGSRPVRIGNQASQQLQLDTYGYLLELVWAWHQRGRGPDEPYWQFIAEIANRVCRWWEEPDSGLWEVRSEPQHFVHSKVMCWAALDRALDLADDVRDVPGVDVDLDLWRKNRRLLREAVLERGVHPSDGHFVQAFDGEAVDAALLLVPATRFVAYDDPTMVATVDRIIDELGDDGLIRRYRTPDGLEGTEGTFITCTFWLVECLAALGREDEAAEWFERACGTSNDLGLFSEEYDPKRSRALGNHPQALSHLSHIAAAMTLGGIDGLGERVANTD